MGEISLTIPRLRRIGARWYWRATRSVRALGFPATVPLGRDAEAAAAQARDWNRRVDEARLRDAEGEPAAETMAALCALYRSSDDFAAKRKSTAAGYRSILGQIEAIVGRTLVASHTRKTLKALLKLVRQKRGHATMVYHAKMWRILMDLAVEEGWRPDNPARFRIVHPASRARVWSDEEVGRFCAAAIAAGRPSMRLAALLGRELGPRRGDAVRMTWAAWREGWFRYRETKGGKLVETPATAALREGVESAPRSATQILVNENTGRPYTVSSFNEGFAAIRKAAGLDRPPAGWDDAIDGPYVVPTFHDLRRTLQTEYADAGATAWEQGTVTGQAADTLPTYTRPTRTQARSAVAKLERHRRSSRKAAPRTGTEREGGKSGGKAVAKRGIAPASTD